MPAERFHGNGRGLAVLSYGFRPFFLAAGVWAALSMALWIAMLSGHAELPTAFGAVDWHAHEFLFGYVGAVMAGFLLTAVPNWTGRPPITGWPLGALVALCLAGRLVVLTSSAGSPALVAAADLSFLAVLIVVIARELVLSRNWRNLVILALVTVLLIGNAAFHLESEGGGSAAQGLGVRVALGAIVMMISIIGGRIVPAFTQNWIAKNGGSRAPTQMTNYDRIALLALFAALGCWILAPDTMLAGMLMLFAGLSHIVRLARWFDRRCLSEPLVWVLHVGYGFVPLGALFLGGSLLWPADVTSASAQHVWMAGAIGVMTLAVMTRATLGHTGRELTAGPATAAIYGLVVAAVLLRLLAGTVPDTATLLHTLSGLAWIAAFAGFAWCFGPLLLRPRIDA